VPRDAAYWQAGEEWIAAEPAAQTAELVIRKTPWSGQDRLAAWRGIASPDRSRAIGAKRRPPRCDFLPRYGVNVTVAENVRYSTGVLIRLPSHGTVSLLHAWM
jgi:hypothetical protein